MSQQQSMYQPPEREPQSASYTERQQAEIPAYQEGSYQGGYQGSHQETQEDEAFFQNWDRGKIQPRKKLNNWQIFGLIVAAAAVGQLIGSMTNGFLGSLFAILILGGGAALVFWFGFTKVVELPAQTFSVQEMARLTIRNHAGSLRIHRGENNHEVVLRATQRVNTLIGPSASANALRTSQHGDAIQISSDGQVFHHGVVAIDLDITVPASLDLDFHTHAGTITLSGIRGLARLKTNSGTVSIEHSQLSGGSSISTNAGTISMIDTDLIGSTTVETNAGTITYSGALGREGSYKMETNAGTIDVALPDDSSVIVDAKSDLGAITNAFGSTVAGNPPHAQLKLRTNVGTVSIRRRS